MVFARSKSEREQSSADRIYSAHVRWLDTPLVLGGLNGVAFER